MKLLRYTVISLALLLAIGLLCLLALHKDDSVRTEIWIDSPPERVWGVLTNTVAYPVWNPMISRLSGDLRAGNVIEFTEGTGSDRMTFRPRILSLRKAEELKWKGSVLVPGVFDGEHRFLLEDQKGRTHFVQSEKFSGLLVGRLTRGILRDTTEQMMAMNTALKERCERSGEITVTR